ncbi:MAG: 50S ribosomal protein L22 [Actinobacteria bacterium]|nr:50S ribosomal protein L22 [Actinomycetota bacterium]
MTGAKTNERPGVRAQHRHARMSATKARAVLDLIRGKSVVEARTILQFSERGAARTVAKVLDSAVANAANNNSIAPEELFVATAYADEGPTLKRWRPRARGRATRIRKRTCHITIIVGQYSPEEFDAIRSRQAQSGRATPDAAAARARRVAGSRRRSGAKAADEPTADEPTVDDAVSDGAVVEDAALGAAEAAGDEEATVEVVGDAFAGTAGDGDDEAADGEGDSDTKDED